jgi:indolepyruvate ferredoxin oxidoreductase beta subunit
MVHRGTLVITNTRTIVPPGASMSAQGYPQATAVVEALEAACDRVLALDATAVAIEAGSAMAINAVLLGVLAGAGALPFGDGELLAVIEGGVPPAAIEINRSAFEQGRAYARSVE